MIISIVSVCYNNLSGLEETWRNVQGQDFAGWEWIVVDGASTDGTSDFLRQLEDARVSWKSEKDGGIYDAMNRGLDRARGDYVTFLNAGDVFGGLDVLAEVAHVAEAREFPDLLYGDAYEKMPNGSLLRKAALSHRRVWYGMFTHHQAMFYRRAFVDDQRYPTHYKIGGDYAFTAQIIVRGGRASYLPIPLCVFEKGGLSERAPDVGRAEVWRVQKEVLRMPLVSRLAIRLAQVSVHGLKRFSPHLYRALRFRKPLKSSPQ